MTTSIYTRSCFLLLRLQEALQSTPQEQAGCSDTVAPGAVAASILTSAARLPFLPFSKALVCLISMSFVFSFPCYWYLLSFASDSHLAQSWQNSKRQNAVIWWLVFEDAFGETRMRRGRGGCTLICNSGGYPVGKGFTDTVWKDLISKDIIKCTRDIAVCNLLQNTIY